jgi:flavin-dependent dehydrogenase
MALENSENDVWDVVVVGGGPSGAATATLLAQAGWRVRLFERETAPRYHIGESLVPMTYWTLKRLGMLERMQRSRFIRKYSVQFITQDGRETRPFYFFRSIPHESAISWQVWRGEFDQMLLDNAVEKGCRVDFGAHVTDVLFEGEHAVGVRVRTGRTGATQIVPARVVVDATGVSALLGNRLGMRTADPHLQQAAVWTYYRAARRDPGIDAGATLVYSTAGKHGWFWFIPLPDEITSVGVVSSLDRLLGNGRTPAEVFADQLDECPRLAERLENATRTDDYRVIKEYTCTSRLAAGDGWVMVGDAFGFLDPIYSTGILLAFLSAEAAADAIAAGLTTGDLSAAQLGNWQDRHRHAIAIYRKLVYAFYSYKFSFGQFIRQRPEYHQNLADLLIGDVFKEGVEEIFDAIGNPMPFA